MVGGGCQFFPDTADRHHPLEAAPASLACIPAHMFSALRARISKASGYITAVSTKPSPAVYRRRRIVALLLLVAVIALIWWGVSAIIGLFAAGKPDAAPAPSSPAAPATTPATTAESGEATTPGDTPAPQTPAEPQPCQPEDITVTAATDARSYGPDARPKLSFSIENTGANKCTFNVGTAVQQFRITSGSDQIWASTDCQKNPENQQVLLEPGRKFESPQLEWVRERSTPDTCDAERPAAVGGDSYYHLKVTVNGAESEPVMFVLE